MIYHITTQIVWEQARREGEYREVSLENEGFIHCSTIEQVIPVANAFYQTLDGVILLCIDPEKLDAAVKWEAPAHPEGHEPPDNADTQLFPHIYGPINLDAVARVVDLPKTDSAFVLPDDL